MDSNQRSSATKSLQSFAKTYSALLSLTILSGCASKDYRSPATISTQGKENLRTVTVEKSSLGLRLTNIGYNFQGRFSPNGDRIVFVSKDREFHKNNQIYELNLDNYRERRVTYQNGDAQDPLYSADGREIFYTSTTDELKERPSLFFPKKSSLPPTEVYRSDLSGSHIQRLTQVPGYQGMLAFMDDRRSQLLLSTQTSYTSDSLGLARLSLLEKPRLIILGEPKSAPQGALMDAQQQLIWTVPQGENSLVLKKSRTQEPQALALPPGLYRDLAWWDRNQEKLLVSYKGGSDSQLLILDLKNSCSQKVFAHETELRYPQKDPRIQRILFTGIEGLQSHLYLRELTEASVSCISWNNTSAVSNKFFHSLTWSF